MRSLFLLLFLCVCASAQTTSSGSPLAGAGFSNPYPLPVAPGQLLTLYVEAGASGSPAVTATFWNGNASESMPVLQVNQAPSSCSAPSSGACSTLLAVTVQIPLDAPIAVFPFSDLSVVPSSIALVVNGASTAYFGVLPSENHVHILTACDAIVGAAAVSPTSGGLPCAPVITHADGRQVSVNLPAIAGEELVAYATGLGQTNPALTAGQAAAASSPTLAAFSLDFNYRANALATQPGAVGATVSQPLFSGATQGFVGLYQINFIVPAPPSGIRPCVNPGAMPAVGTGGNRVQSNLTVSIGSDVSFDGAGICVTPNT
jgi:uncharacterized protein (TIGR03437 family)